MKYTKTDKKFTAQSIKNYRLSLGLTQEQFGRRFNTPASKGTVSKWEKGISFPSPERFKELSTMTGKSVHYLMTGIKSYNDLSEEEKETINKKEQQFILERENRLSEQWQNVESIFPHLLNEKEMEILTSEERALIINVITLISETRTRGRGGITTLLNETVINNILDVLTQKSSIEEFNKKKMAVDAGVFAIFSQI
ncbi:helix-turn-helix domain-containing protein [Pediococcus pentosaceus]|uniref:helix-turn-helix domain-containing protein n=1 Tax=Pediococcus pentosaceus TaxID=1255 RepID=UPI0018FE1C35|nr:helix-turn-helix transcriptional regulator [Pediococcus pentosaceus]MBF7131610.1 helix-turn-helix transcriptional regulator [Pediococcus pentosaceus]MCS8573087.1 XRE family transcriptional regulator [Pediococcus pentosaceus]